MVKRPISEEHKELTVKLTRQINDTVINHPKAIQQILLEYEIASTWWARYLHSEKLQRLASKYFARKVKRKFDRFLKSKKLSKKIHHRKDIIDATRRN